MKDVAGFFYSYFCILPVFFNDLYYIPNLYSVTFKKGGKEFLPPLFDYGNGARIASDL
jgi:hypothetical protein